MPFKAETYRVLIASPSDLSEERQVATEAINEWNAQHSAAEAVVLLPVKWETHATPRSGVRPQEAINDQLVTNRSTSSTVPDSAMPVFVPNLVQNKYVGYSNRHGYRTTRIRVKSGR